MLNMPRRLKMALAKFRISNHELAVETGRHQNMIHEDRLCKVCGQQNIAVVECEYHFLMQCPAYEELRQVYFGEECSINNTLFDFINHMKCKSDNMIIALANFICSAFAIRKAILCGETY